MMIAFFLIFHTPEQPGTRMSAAERARVGALVRAVPGLQKALLFTPASADDPHLDDGPPPLLALQLYVAEAAALETALARSSPLQELASAHGFPSLIGAAATQQAMQARAFEVPEPAGPSRPEALSCTYLVGYDGAADDPDAWLAHYTTHHAPLMARLPGVREVEVYSRTEWRSTLPWPRADHLQRNKVVFDDAAALSAALNSPIRHEMRADFHRFPRFQGRVTHHPLATRLVATRGQWPPR